MKKRDFIPLIMWYLPASGIVLMAVIRFLRDMGPWGRNFLNPDIAFVVLYLLWMVLELRISRRDADTRAKSTSDFATCQLNGLGQALTFLSALWYPSHWPAPNPAHGLGTAVFLMGAGYRLWAIRALGRFYAHRVRTLEDHTIVASGPYRFMRHPAYTGMILANVGILIYFFNWVTVAVFLVILIPAIFLRILIEERTLFKIEGYAEFARKRKRRFPDFL